MKKKYWTGEEIQFIRENIGVLKVPTIAKKLNRTETAVLLKLKRLGLANTKAYAGNLTMHQLANLLKVDAKTVKLWIENHGLLCKRRVTRSTRKFYFISQEEFWCWASINKEKIDFSKIERQTIVPEPEWVEKARANNKQNKNKYKSWTTNEVKFMLHLLSTGSNFEYIGKQLDRTSTSVARKYDRVKYQ
ncbi:DNA-binding protein [Aquibacillus halophilus]|uniref:DNA-binding protein n=1 Tax=Aquibacillus halophilus TaxID=930132 RepID=A0A6A8DDV1_9BACI|nr:DNA-binding protein [Aquibacillus halophilus]MRH43858.1 DNA-binding protein [Aquibacillus halophilus]